MHLDIVWETVALQMPNSVSSETDRLLASPPRNDPGKERLVVLYVFGPDPQGGDLRKEQQDSASAIARTQESSILKVLRSIARARCAKVKLACALG